MRAGRVGPEVPVPHEDGAWMRFKTLAAWQLDEAEMTATKAALAFTSEINPELLKSIREGASETARKELDSYDKTTLIKYGLAACSECDPCTSFELDVATRDWAAAQILELNVRPLASGSDSASSSSAANSRKNLESLTAST